MSPAMRIVHADADVRAALARDLTERFGATYDIAAYADAEPGVAALRADARAGRRVAVVFSDESPPGGSAGVSAAGNVRHGSVPRRSAAARSPSSSSTCAWPSSADRTKRGQTPSGA
jgi:hypothetical protein